MTQPTPDGTRQHSSRLELAYTVVVASSPTLEIADLSGLVARLRARADAYPDPRPASDRQRRLLTTVLRGVGQTHAIAVLKAAWDLSVPGEITAAQADAILDEAVLAESREDFHDTWLSAASVMEWHARPGREGGMA